MINIEENEQGKEMNQIANKVDVGDDLTHLHKATIMMVDDESLNLEIIQLHLEEAGYSRFILLDQSVEAMDTIMQEEPDILLLDLMMPEVTGFEILQYMRSNEKLKYLPVIILTSSSDPEDKLRALELGATDFLSKPVDPSELLLRVRNTLTVKAYQDQLAYYDALTGLPNRRLFVDRTSWAIQQAERAGHAAALLHVSLDRIKDINDSFGPKAGKTLIQDVAKTIQEYVRTADVISNSMKDNDEGLIARVAEGEFSILLPDIKNSEHASIAARRILDVLSRGFLVENNRIVLTTNIGISIFPEDGKTAERLLSTAMNASGQAKMAGRNNHQFYSKEMNARNIAKLKLESHLRDAIEKDQLELYYQPQICSKTNAVLGMEALLRWHHPELGMIPPDTFIPLAEETGLITPIGAWVIRESCRQTRAWQLQGLNSLTISVNVSGEQFRSHNLKEVVEHALHSTGLEPRYLVVEVTESTIMGDLERSFDLLNELKALGVSLSIDDFGTGHSSLSYLRRFPLDEIKIDQSFIKNVHDNQEDAAIVEAIIALAKALCLRIIAEGVETHSQLSFLQQRGCDEIQGFLFSKPLPKEHFPSFVNQEQAKTGAA